MMSHPDGLKAKLKWSTACCCDNQNPMMIKGGVPDQRTTTQVQTPNRRMATQENIIFNQQDLQSTGPTVPLKLRQPSHCTSFWMESWHHLSTWHQCKHKQSKAKNGNKQEMKAVFKLDYSQSWEKVRHNQSPRDKVCREPCVTETQWCWDDA